MHVAIIVDGNGRWGMKHYGIRTKGHETAARNVWQLVQNLPLEVNYLTLYGLSIDNIEKRPAREVATLYEIFEKSFREGLGKAREGNIRLNFLGDGNLPAGLTNLVSRAVRETVTNSGLVLSIALSYGGRDEIKRAASKLVQSGRDITVDSIAQSLDTSTLPNLDILIRTGGEKRLSDFLLWQAAYTELFFTDTLFPDFNIDEFKDILEEYQARHRRFGGL